MKSTYIKVENNNISESIKKFFSSLLESGYIRALLVPKQLSPDHGYVQTLITDPRMLDTIDPFAPTMPVQSASILAALSKEPVPGRIGVVLKPCELKASVELSKFLQVRVDDLVLIGVDCMGTYEVKDYKEIAKQQKSIPMKTRLFSAARGDITPIEGYTIRECCRICIDPVPMNPDILLGFYGIDPEKGLFISTGTRVDRELIQSLSLTGEDADTIKRDEVVKKIKETRSRERTGVLDSIREKTNTMEKLMEVLSTCIRCHNCMNVCPICYCNECVFSSSIFKHKPEQILNLANRKGGIRMPGDTLIFHLTRMSHMATSCVSCGMCESACPSGIPVSSLFSSMGKEVQALFDYVPGRDFGEKPPVSTFKENELE